MFSHSTPTPISPSTDEALTPEQPLTRMAPTIFKASDVTTAVNRTTELARVHPSWPQARVRGIVAREMAISTVQLRYLLRKAAAQAE